MKFVTSISPNRTERQQHCINTWLELGYGVIALQPPHLVEQTRKDYSRVEVIGVRPEQTAADQGKPNHVLVSAHIAMADKLDEMIMLVNADIAIKCSRAKFRQNWVRPHGGIFLCGIRTERLSAHDKWLTPFGIDMFRITPQQARTVTCRGFYIGGCVWDNWMLWHMADSGFRVQARKEAYYLHDYHPVNWTEDDLEESHAKFKKEYGVSWHLLHQFTKAITGRAGIKNPKLRVRLTRTQRTYRDQKICIVGAPRTGGNLLMYSLAAHPAAQCLGEVFCKHNRPATQEVQDRARLPIDETNLCKVPIWKEHTTLAAEALEKAAVVVYLRRRDIEAQLASWLKAAASGRWRADGIAQPKRPQDPGDCRAQIKAADERWLDRADMVIDYEDLVDEWDALTGAVQAAAGWPVQKLAKATKRQM